MAWDGGAVVQLVFWGELSDRPAINLKRASEIALIVSLGGTSTLSSCLVLVFVCRLYLFHFAKVTRQKLLLIILIDRQYILLHVDLTHALLPNVFEGRLRAIVLLL